MSAPSLTPPCLPSRAASGPVRTRLARPRPAGFALLVALGPGTALLAPAAAAQTRQVTFSIDFDSPSISVPDACAGVPITEGDILAPADPAGVCPGPGNPSLGPLPPPVISISGGFGPPAPGLGLPAHPGCIGHPPGAPCGVELDALSYGRDGLLDRVNYFPKGKVIFSVDRCSMGFPGLPQIPNVESEGIPVPIGDAAADAFWDFGLPLAGFPLPPLPIGNTGAIDGNGLVSVPTLVPSGFAYPGLGLLELSPFPVPGGLPDELDALDVEGFGTGVFPATGVYYSLDNQTPDFCIGSPGSNSAPINGGFVGGDVLWTPAPGAGPVLFAPAFALGLDLAAGPNTDDLDALALVENGSGAFEPSMIPFDWMGGGTDMLLFSVRRGSAVIGLPDSITGLPIEAGDVLTTPLPTASGGVSPFPGIVIPAEVLGLATLRAGFAGGDDLDAFDVLQAPVRLFWANACYGIGCPCGNDDPTAGCANSTGAGGLLQPTAGTSSVGADDLVLTATGLPLGQQGLFYMGSTIVNAPFFDGRQCALGTTFRFLGSIQSTGVTGTMTYGPGIAAASGGLIVPGSVWYFQAWHRDVPGTPCGTGANLTNATGVCFTP